MTGRLHVKNLGFAYGSTDILRDVSFQAERGEMCAILGPNGAGKTTLLKCLCGISSFSKGSVHIGDEDVLTMERQRRSAMIAMVPQMVHVLFPYTVLQMVLMARVGQHGRMWSPGRSDRGEALKILGEMNCGHIASRIFNELSGGEQQLVLLARALYQKPSLLLLDEPTSHLDFRNQYAVLDQVSRVTRERNIISLISLHDPNLAARYCSGMILLRSGAVVGHGVVDGVFTADALGKLYGLSLKITTTSGGHRIVLPCEESL